MRPLVPWLLVAAAAFVGASGAAAVVVSRPGPAVVEIRLGGLGAPELDRCPTCHRVEPGRELPDGHPAVAGYHPVERFGCAGCHGGEPRALEASWAHRRGREPLLHLGSDGSTHPERLEAGCARCHAQLGPEGLSYDASLLPRAARGLELFVGVGCWGCHRLADRSFGERGPDLSDVGARLSGDEIRLAIADPGAHPSSTTMPRFRLDDASLADLTVVLLAQVDPARRAALETARLLEAQQPGAPPRRPRVERGMAAGADVMRRLGCLGCHRTDSGDGRVGPDLRWEGDLRGPRYVRDMLDRPSLTVSGSRMPPLDLSESELDATIEYLARLRGLPPPTIEDAWRDVCARCHGLDGAGRTAVAPYLSTRPRDLSASAWFRAVDSGRLARAMSDGVAGTAMAPWARAAPVLGGSRIVGLLGRKLHGGGLPGRRLPPVDPPPEVLSDGARVAARRVFDRECTACHGPRGRGDGPEAAGMRPRPRDLADAAFIASLDDARLYRSIAYGPPGAPMPGHLEGYDPPAMWALVEIVRLVAGRPATGPYEDDLWPFEPAPRGPAAKAPGPRVPPAPPSAP